MWYVMKTVFNFPQKDIILCVQHFMVSLIGLVFLSVLLQFENNFYFMQHWFYTHFFFF